MRHCRMSVGVPPPRWWDCFRRWRGGRFRMSSEPFEHRRLSFKRVLGGVRFETLYHHPATFIAVIRMAPVITTPITMRLLVTGLGTRSVDVAEIPMGKPNTTPIPALISQFSVVDVDAISLASIIGMMK